MNDLANEERETHLNMVADKRDEWECYSDDPVMIARLDKIASGTRRGYGMVYVLRADQVLIRAGSGKPRGKPMAKGTNTPGA